MWLLFLKHEDEQRQATSRHAHNSVQKRFKKTLEAFMQEPMFSKCLWLRLNQESSFLKLVEVRPMKVMQMQQLELPLESANPILPRPRAAFNLWYLQNSAFANLPRSFPPLLGDDRHVIVSSRAELICCLGFLMMLLHRRGCTGTLFSEQLLPAFREAIPFCGPSGHSQVRMSVRPKSYVAI